MSLPPDAIPVIDWPEYAITPCGQVWRVAADPRIDAQRGPVPRQVKVLMMGGRADRTHKHPAIKLSRHGVTSNRTIRSLVRQHFGE